jgi:GNAT superfamily N-acetyltransferase
MSLWIRAYDPAQDLADLRRCFIELQDHEHGFDPLSPTGAEIVDSYVPYMLARCEAPDSVLFVAEVDGRVVGFASAIRVERPSSDDCDAFHFELGELGVLDEHRGGGVGTALVAAVERHARAHRAPALRVSMGAANEGAQRLYARLGFAPCVIMCERRLDATAPSDAPTDDLDASDRRPSRPPSS